MEDDPELRYSKSNRWTWLIDKTAYVGGTVLQAFITTLVLSAGYMVFNDFIAPVPDLTGRWKFTIYYENTANTKFQGLAVTYQVLMIQDGFNLSGHGEKISERGPTQKALDYVGAQRTSIEVIGRITRRFFLGDVVVFRYKEAGLRRETSTIQRLVLCSRGALSGCFLTTIADTSGPVRWQPVFSQDGKYEPVERSSSCDETFDCKAAAMMSF